MHKRSKTIENESNLLCIITFLCQPQVSEFAKTLASLYAIENSDKTAKLKEIP